MRDVVVLAAEAGARPCLECCWGRRYLCLLCRGTFFVLPPGVLPRFLYSLAAIVSAWIAVARKPVGDGLSDADAYRRQGAFRRLRWLDEETWRWRSLGRWLRHADRWWPSRVENSIEGLLVGFGLGAGTEPGEVIRRSIAAAGCAV